MKTTPQCNRIRDIDTCVSPRQHRTKAGPLPAFIDTHMLPQVTQRCVAVHQLFISSFWQVVAMFIDVAAIKRKQFQPPRGMARKVPPRFTCPCQRSTTRFLVSSEHETIRYRQTSIAHQIFSSATLSLARSWTPVRAFLIPPKIFVCRSCRSRRIVLNRGPELLASFDILTRQLNKYAVCVPSITYPNLIFIYHRN